MTGRVLAAGASLALVWCAGGAVVFLLAPVLSALPTAWGALGGGVAFVLQLLLGEGLVRSLLRLSPSPVGPPVWIDEERPFLLALGGEPQLVPTRGLLEHLGDETGELERVLAERRRGASGALLTRMLAVPCLLRAVHSATSRYARLRGGTGPVYVLGEAFLALARALEWPLRLLALPAPTAGEVARLRLEGLLARHPEFPAWMEALALLAPVTLEGVRRRARTAALAGGEPSEEALPEPRRSPVRHLPLLGLLLGLVLASLPSGPLAAPLVFLALGMAARRLWEFPRAQAPAGEALSALALRAAREGRGVPVRLSGRLVDCPEGLAVSPGGWLDTGQGLIRLQNLPVSDGEAREVTGWLLPEGPEVLVGEVLQGGRRRRLFPLVRRLLVPLALALLGGTWWLLQGVGL